MNTIELIKQAASEGNLEVVRWLANHLDKEPAAQAVLEPFARTPGDHVNTRKEKQRENARNWASKQYEAGRVRVRQDNGKYMFVDKKDTVWILNNGHSRRVMRDSIEFARYRETNDKFFPGDQEFGQSETKQDLPTITTVCQQQ